VMFLPVPCYVFPLRPKCSSQHRILEQLQPTLLPQYERPSHTPIQNGKVIVLCILIFIFFGKQTGRQTIMARMVAGIPWVQILFISYWFFTVVTVVASCLEFAT
jgi:hypothetical protein